MRMTSLVRRSIRLVGAARSVALAASVGLLGGCSALTDALAPGRPGAEPARVALSATVSESVGRRATAVALEVSASYLRTNGTLAPIGRQTIPLSAAALEQAVPIPIDVATCLADRERDQSAGASVCAAVIRLLLVVDGAVVDEQVVGPLRLTPGATTRVTESVQLFEIAGVTISTADGEPVPAGSVSTLFLGQSLELRGTVRDSRDQPVADRAVAWRSSAPSIATVSPTGTVTPLAIGRTTITATIGSVSSSVVLDVVRAPAALTILADAGSGRGVVRSAPAGIDCAIDGATASGACSHTFPGDAVVTLTSTPDASNLFRAWGDACSSSGTATSCQVTMSQPVAVRASFTALRLVRVVAAGGDGRGRVTGAGGLDCAITGATTAGDCQVEVAEGTQLTLMAVPQPGAGGLPSRQSFGGWGGVCEGTTGTTCVVTATGASREVAASFFDEKRVTVTVSGEGSGTITSNGALACASVVGEASGQCAESVLHGATVVLTATPDARSLFAGWAGACSGEAPTCTVQATAATTVVATFRPRTTSLLLVLSGGGAGTVSIDGAVACTLAAGQGRIECLREVEIDRTIQVSAAGSGASTFVGFGGACTGTSGCAIEMTGARTLTASFAAPLVPVTVRLSGPGAGSVRIGTSEPCVIGMQQAPVDCTVEVAQGSAVTITATAADGSSFAGYGTPCPPSGPACVLTVTGAVDVTATFTANPVLVSVTGMPGTVGDGTVRSIGGSDAIQCTFVGGVASATGCSALVPYGTQLSLHAAAAPANLLADWGDDCASAETVTCIVTLTRPLRVGARFIKGIDANVTINGSGRGAVTFRVAGTPSQDACARIGSQGPVTCRFTIPVGGTGFLSGVPFTGSTFSGFTGACANLGQASPLLQCEFNGVSFSRNVTATFSN